ncbi:hypothetical protein QCA50_020353 [Cerrena zonata]|uniref:Nephrocystin 3-like N-terminal domain-containing protein n=1 Tax=Cerrena zonata TaxID=2478898 RepID=A0AAW0F9M3_9APHY
MAIGLILHIDGVRGVELKHRLLGKDTSKLYVEVQVKERDVRRWVNPKDIHDIAAEWGEELILIEVEDKDILQFSLNIVRTQPRKDYAIGEADYKVSDLLPPDSPKELNLIDTSDKGKAHIVGILAIHAEVVSSIDATRCLQDRVNVAATGRLDPNNLTDGVMQIMGKLSALKGVINTIDELAGLHSWLKFTWDVLSSLYKMAEKQCSTDKKALDLVKTVNRTLDFAEDIKKLGEDGKKLDEDLSHFERLIEKILQQVTESALFVAQYLRPGFLKRLIKQLLVDSNEKIDETIKALAELQHDLDSGIQLYTAKVSSKVLERQLQATLVSAKVLTNTSNLGHSDALDVLKPANMSIGSRPVCLQGTRDAVLEKLTDWAININGSEQNILWLHGLAGTGKSTIARTLSDHLGDLGRKGAFLFFERGKTDRDALIQTLAAQLAHSDSLLKYHICKAIDQDRNIVNTGLEKQFKHLILNPLTEAADSLHGPIVIVFNALDEYGDVNTREILLSLIINHFTQLPNTFRFLITSRRESDIETAFSEIMSISLMEIDDATSAIRSYLLSRLTHIPEMKVILESDCNSWRWPEKTNMDHLVYMSEGLFIWASTLTNFLFGAADPAERLEGILSSGSNAYVQGLDALYDTVLGAHYDWGDKGVAERFQSIVGIALFHPDSLSDVDIDQFLGLSDRKSCGTFFKAFRSLFDYDPGKPIRPLHASFRDYLTDEKHSKGKPWSLAGFDADRHLAMCCFRVMSKQLHFNICNFETSDCQNTDYPDLNERIEKNISPVLRYASSHWTGHLRRVKASTPDLQGALESFSKKQIFFWLEVVSVCCSVFDCQTSCNRVRVFLQNKKNASKLVSLWDSVVDFWQKYGMIIQKYTPHLYVSGFTYPEDSALMLTYASLFTTAKVIICQDAMQTLPEDESEHANQYGYSGKHNCVSFSPDGTKFLVSSGDSIHVHNSSDYTLIREYWPLKYASPVAHAIFSANSQHIYVALEDGTIHTSSGEILCKPSGDLGILHSMCLHISSSEEGIYVLYENGALVVSSDGALIQKPYMFDPDGYLCSSISQKGLLAFVPWKERSQIHFLDLTENTTSSVHVSNKSVRDIVFTPDGDKVVLLAMDHLDMSILFWDINTQKPLKNLPFGDVDCNICNVSQIIFLYGT